MEERAAVVKVIVMIRKISAMSSLTIKVPSMVMKMVMVNIMATTMIVLDHYLKYSFVSWLQF